MGADGPPSELGPLALGMQRRGSFVVYHTSGNVPSAANRKASAPPPPPAPAIAKPRPLGDSNGLSRPAALQRPSLQRVSIKTSAATGVEASGTDTISWRTICEEARAEADRKRGVNIPIDDRSELKQWLFHDIMQLQGHPLHPRRMTSSPPSQPPHVPPPPQQQQLFAGGFTPFTARFGAVGHGPHSVASAAPEAGSTPTASRGAGN